MNSKKDKIPTKELKAEAEHFYKLLDDLTRIETMKEGIQKISSGQLSKEKDNEITQIHQTIHTALFLEKERDYIESCLEHATMRKAIRSSKLLTENETEKLNIHILNAKIRTCRNLYWSGKLIGLKTYIEDIPALLKEQEAELKRMQLRLN